MTLHAQHFELYKQGEVQKLKLDKDWYLVQNLGNEEECCHSRRMLGRITKMSQDSVYMSVGQLQTRRTDSEKSYLSTIMYNTTQDLPIYAIAKSDVKNVQEERSTFKNVLEFTGGVLLFTSVVTALNALLVDNEDRKTLLIASGIQLGASLTLIGIGATKTNKYKIHENAWQF